MLQVFGEKAKSEEDPDKQAMLLNTLVSRVVVLFALVMCLLECLDPGEVFVRVS